MIPTSSSSSSSTLSPLAPPFTVDRPNSSSSSSSNNKNTHHRFQSYPYTHPLTVPPEFSSNGKVAVPTKAVAATNSSSWLDQSLGYNVSQFHKGGAPESFMTYEDDYRAWHGKHVDSSSRPVHFGSDCSAWRDNEHCKIYEEEARASCDNGLSYFHLPGPNTVIDELAQLVSSSTNPIDYYPSATHSSSTQVYSSANGNSSSIYSVPRSGYTSTQCGNLLYKVNDNYVDYILGKRKEPGNNQYPDGVEGYVKESIVKNNVKGNNGTGDSSTLKACSSLGNEAATGMECSVEVNCGLITKHLNFPDSFATLSRPDNSMQTSSKTPDQPNVTVDSPCWRGAMVSQLCSFGGAEMVDPYPGAKESKGFDDLDQGRRHLPASVQYSRTLPYEEKDGGLACHGNMRGSLSFLGDCSPKISSNGTVQKFHDVNAKGSNCAELENEKRSHCSYVHGEISNETPKDQTKDAERANINVKQLGQEGNVVISVNSPIRMSGSAYPEAGLTDTAQSNPNPDSGNHVMNLPFPGAILGEIIKPIGSSYPAGKSLAAEDVNIIVKAMHGLSQVLLSSYNGVAELKEYDHELVQLVIDNLDAFICGNKKDTRNCCSHAPGHDLGQSRVLVSEVNDTVKNMNNTSNQVVKGKKFQNVNSDKFNKFATKGADIDMRRFNGITQTLDKDLEENIFEQEEGNLQAVLYKNLWMQAEAALCSMKYEHQLARMKLEMETCGFQAKAKEPAQVMKSPGSDCVRGSDGPRCAAQQISCSDASIHSGYATGKISNGKPNDGKINNGDKLEASVMARLEVLKGRYDRSNNACIEEQLKSSDHENGHREVPTRLADLGFVETGFRQPFTQDEHTDGHPDLDLNYNEDNAVRQESPGHTLSEISLVCTADGPLSQQFITSKRSRRNPLRIMLG